jgi:hypothetical protein
VTGEQGFRSPLVLLRLTAGFVVWGLHFLFVYVFAAVACTGGQASQQLLGMGIIPTVTLVATVTALIANAVIAGSNLPAHRPDGLAFFVRWFTIATALGSSVAVLLNAVPVLLLQDCR